MTEIDNVHPTAVGRVFRRWLADAGPVPGAGEEETARRSDRLADAVASLAKLPAQDWPDVADKLSVLAARRRQDASVDDPETMLDVLLVEAVRDDVLRLSITATKVP